MHQHPRGPPVLASPANSPRTNPSRTNNLRETESGSSSERGTLSEPGIASGEGSDTVMRAHESSGQGRDAIAKLSQIVQVCIEKSFPLGDQGRFTNYVITKELLYQVCAHHTARSGAASACVRKRI